MMKSWGERGNNQQKTVSTKRLLTEPDGEIVLPLKEGCLPINRRRERMAVVSGAFEVLVVGS